MSAPRAGEVIAGKYRVDRVLGQGAMGVVLAATHLQLGQSVAIKLLLDGATRESSTRFLREARAAVRLRSEHVARVLDVGELEDGSPFMVMEYLHGNDLKEVLKLRGPLPVEEAVEHVLQACEAIAEAHAAGIIHRDLKPANLFLTKTADGSSTVKVLDFGISKSADSDADGDGLQLTRSTAVLGSPLYMSPEQINSARNANAQSDIWSLGAILYQLLAGEVPFRTTSFSDLVLMVNTRPPPSLTLIRGDIPPGLDAAVLRSLQKDLTARFSNVAEFAWAIAPYGPPTAQSSARSITRMLEAAGVQVKRPPDASMTSVPPPPPTIPSEKPLGLTATRGAKTNPSPADVTPWPGWVMPVLIGGTIGIVALAIAFFLIMRSRGSDPGPDVPPPPSATAPATAVPPAPTSAGAASSAPVPMVTASADLPPAPAPATAEPRASASASSSQKRVPPQPAQPTTASAKAPATAAPGPARNPLDIKLKD